MCRADDVVPTVRWDAQRCSQRRVSTAAARVAHQALVSGKDNDVVVPSGSLALEAIRWAASMLPAEQSAAKWEKQLV